jgi:hypothetical protein
VNGRTIYWLLECPPTMMFAGDYQFLTNPDGTPTGNEPRG